MRSRVRADECITKERDPPHQGRSEIRRICATVISEEVDSLKVALLSPPCKSVGGFVTMRMSRLPARLWSCRLMPSNTWRD